MSRHRTIAIILITVGMALLVFAASCAKPAAAEQNHGPKHPAADSAKVGPCMLYQTSFNGYWYRYVVCDSAHHVSMMGY